MRVSIIVAAATNRVIGLRGELPWHLPDDLRRFRKLTTGKPVIMGRLTHESIGRPLPDRRNIVVSRQPGYQPAGCEVVASPTAALDAVADSEEAMVIGGGRIYKQMLPLCNRIYLTRVHANP
ncbi:MAG: dihydrofolate reductase, partial [Woeseia sp.]|nr:dihydrofolate reductase [Woeseia sp.]